jgi:hypothetical protein
MPFPIQVQPDAVMPCLCPDQDEYGISVYENLKQKPRMRESGQKKSELNVSYMHLMITMTTNIKNIEE